MFAKSLVKFRRVLVTGQWRGFAEVSGAQAPVRPEVHEKIFELLRASPKCNKDKLLPEARFVELGFDSLDVVELVVAFEENLGYDLPNEVAEGKMETVQDALVAFSKFYPAEKQQE